MLLREFFIDPEEEKLDELAFVAPPLYLLLQQALMFGGTAIAAYIASEAIKDADIKFPSIETDFISDIESNIDIPQGQSFLPSDFDASAADITAYLNNRDPNRKRKGRVRGKEDIIEEIVDWLRLLLGKKLLLILVGLGLSLFAIYKIYKMSKSLVKKYKADKGIKELEKELQRLLDDEPGIEEGQTWARSGKKVVRKFRCSGGPRKNRVVAKMAQCFAAPDIKKRQTLKKTKARLGGRMARKSKKTKRINPASKRIQSLNKRRR